MTAVEVPVREGSYGKQVIAVEPGGAEVIPLAERHGHPLQLLWVWGVPNIGLGNAFIGIIAVAAFGLGWWPAIIALTLGTAIPSVTQGILSVRGPRYGVPQMVLSRFGFGYWGNVLPTGINWLTGSVGWFGVNLVGTAFALAALTHWSTLVCLVIATVVQVAIAFAGHNMIQAVEKYVFPVIALASLVGAVFFLVKAHPGAPHHTIPGAFLLAFAAAWGNAAGWNPFAADYARYLKPSVSKQAVAWWSGLGIMTCALMLVAGVAAGTVLNAKLALGANPVGAMVSLMPHWFADITLWLIIVGGVAGNVLNVYSGALSATALGFNLPLKQRRAIVAFVSSVAGFFLAWVGLNGAASKYTNFLLIIAYWIAPWLAVYFCDLILRRNPADGLLFARRENWAGPVAMAAGMGISIWLFSVQTYYTGLVAKHVPAVGDLTFEAGFVITAVIYLGWCLLARTGRETTVPA